ncbi:cytosol aminopeptidase-like [Watersipora subatra]|uniref:cytosol aminopeptidase-like n=1 Tax=Watersipora subatra TaxID=2589382 RepID=UPI00355BC977
MITPFNTMFLRRIRNFSVYSSAAASTLTRKALVLGLFKTEESVSYTRSTKHYIDSNPTLNANLDDILGGKFKEGSSRLLYNQSNYDVVCLTNLGPLNKGAYDELEELYTHRESIRGSISKSIKALINEGVTQVEVDGCGDPEASAEGATLTHYSYDDFKSSKADPLEILPHSLKDGALTEWNRGKTLADSQNLARWLMESPSNFMTPSRFAQVAQDRLPESCNVVVHEKEWIEQEKMNSFLSVAQGSIEKPVFLEVQYRGDKSDEKHIALVGKGVTFDSGGISIKPSANMDAMRADMGGAACTLAALWGVAKLALPVNVSLYIPLTDNMPSGSAIKPGDVVTSRNGKTIQIDNTDAEGRLILADALDYASTFKPTCMLDLATLTGAIDVALGAGATGTFSNSGQLWTDMHEAAKHTGDRVWRMPLYKLYTSQINKTPLADLSNVGSAGKGGACTAAAFLQEFVSCDHWAHLDIAGVMSNTDQIPYLSKGMAGRPTRTIIEFLSKVNLNKY